MFVTCFVLPMKLSDCLNSISLSGFISYQTWNNLNITNYSTSVQLRMSHRMIGVAGFYLLFAFFQSSKPRHKPLRFIGHIVVGIYILAAAYIVLQSPEDKESFLRFVPGSRPVLFVYGTLLATVGLCYLPGQFVYDVTLALIVLVTASTAFVDTRFSYWTTRRGIDYWNQMRLVTDNIMIVVGAVMYVLEHKEEETFEDRVILDAGNVSVECFFLLIQISNCLLFVLHAFKDICLSIIHIVLHFALCNG